MSLEAKYTPTMKQDVAGFSQVCFHSITAMPEYENYSFEEIRLRDYSHMKKSTVKQTTTMSKETSNSIPVFFLKNNSSVPASVVSSMYHPKTTRTKVTNFYKLFNPIKINDVDKLLTKYRGNESVLFERLAKKYNQNVSIFDHLIHEISFVKDSVTEKSPAFATSATSTSQPVVHFAASTVSASPTVIQGPDLKTNEKPQPTSTVPVFSTSPSVAAIPSDGKDEGKQPSEVQQIPNTQKPPAVSVPTTTDSSIRASDKESPRMMDTPVGKACMFVDMILTSISSIPQGKSSNGLSLKPVARDAMFDMAKKLLMKQEELFLQGFSTQVDYAFHYTTEEYLENIQLAGLLSHEERLKQRKKQTHKNGQVFGNGIYTANNLFAFQKFGPVGLVVARLKGSCSQRVKKLAHIQDGHNYTSIVGNKVLEHDPIGYYDETVLLESSQVIPLVCFETEAINFKNTPPSVVEDRLQSLYGVIKELQHVVNNICNNDDNQAKLGTDTEFVSLYEFKTFYASLKTQPVGNAQKIPNTSAQSNVQSQATSVNVNGTALLPMSSTAPKSFASGINASAPAPVPAPKPTAAPFPPMSTAAPKPFRGVNKSSVPAPASAFKSVEAAFPPMSTVAVWKNSSGVQSMTAASTRNSSAVPSSRPLGASVGFSQPVVSRAVSATQNSSPSFGTVKQRKKSVQSTQVPRSPDPPGAIGIGGVNTQAASSGWTVGPKYTTSNTGGRVSLQATNAATNASFCGNAPPNVSSNAPDITSGTSTASNGNIHSLWGGNTISFSSSTNTGFNGVFGTGNGGFDPTASKPLFNIGAGPTSLGADGNITPLRHARQITARKQNGRRRIRRLKRPR